MPGELETPKPTTNPNPATTPTVVAESPSEPVASPVEKPGSNPKVISLPSNALTRIKAEARERGRKAAALEADKAAQALGYKSHADMMAKLEQQRARGKRPLPVDSDDVDESSDDGSEELESEDEEQAARPSGKPNQNRQQNQKKPVQENSRVISRLEKEKQQLLLDRKRLAKQRQLEMKRSRRIQRQLDANEAESQLRIAAVRAGLQDIEYALHLVKNEMRGKSAAELETFDENTYFSETLRKSHPYLYGVETQPATTGNGGAPAAKTPKEPPAETGAPVDARKISPAEYEALLKKKGLSRPLFGMVG